MTRAFLSALALLGLLAAPAAAQPNLQGSRESCVANNGLFVASARIRVSLLEDGRNRIGPLLMQLETPVLRQGQRYCFTVQRDAIVQVRFRHHNGFVWVEDSCGMAFNGYDSGAAIWGTTFNVSCGGLG